MNLNKTEGQRRPKIMSSKKQDELRTQMAAVGAVSWFCCFSMADATKKVKVNSNLWNKTPTSLAQISSSSGECSCALGCDLQCTACD